MAGIIGEATLWSRFFEIVMAPANYPDLIPSVLPIIVGAFVIELYFGKHKTEVLGWNTSVGNAVIWISTALNMILTEQADTSLEKWVVFFILGLGILLAYLDFFHKWSSTVAFRASSADVIYPLAYVTVVIVKSPIPADDMAIQASILFMGASFIFFRLIRSFETPAPDDFMKMAGR